MIVSTARVSTLQPSRRAAVRGGDEHALRIVDGYYSERFLETSLPFLRCCAVLPYGHSKPVTTGAQGSKE
jgi:hypothetical protein